MSIHMTKLQYHHSQANHTLAAHDSQRGAYEYLYPLGGWYDLEVYRGCTKGKSNIVRTQQIIEWMKICLPLEKLS